MQKIIDKILSLIFPKRCPFCGTVVSFGEHACKECTASIAFVEGEVCPRCGRGRKYCRCEQNFTFDRCTAPFYYEDKVRRAIINFKFHAKSNSAEAFAFYCTETVKREYAGIKLDFVSCVPITRAERAKRGFNQSEIFGRALAKQLGLPFKNALLKPEDIKPQRKLSARERKKNVVGAFRGALKLHGECVLLADDIITTGATLNDCARALKKAGAEKVFCAVIACVREHDNFAADGEKSDRGTP